MSEGLIGLAVVGLGAFWFGVAPHVAVRHWTAVDGVVQCRQMLNGAQQWDDPQAGRLQWSADRGGYC